MSNRTLLEINHDQWGAIRDDPWLFAASLLRYLGSGCKETAEPLERFGVRVISMRHHADKFWIKEGTEGFPAKSYKADRP